MDRYICIHGHFYQPPRENAWLETIELQDSAYPYHDWNERVTAECYAPNAAARVLDADRRIVRIANNYARMSFNFGPTLLAWLENNSPETYRAILEADRQSAATFSGHGSAMAQAYNHMILPLANARDKRTQVIWGVRDFAHRFGRQPEGMWLPEAAVDLATMEALADQGLRFTVLAPSQARRERRIGGRNWRDVSGGRIDPSRAYRLRLPSGRTINLFFYDGPISAAVAFDHLLDNGERFVERLVGGFSDARAWPQLSHIATDGETYGHHHRYGEMALAYALQYIETNSLARLTNYGEFLEHYPPTHEVEIVPNSSWSCAHGVERWRADCGCNSGTHPGWRQAWRGPLRKALDWLRDALAPAYERRAAALVHDPWAARDDYIDVILDRSDESLDRFLARHAVRELSAAEQTALWQLLELQRHAMLMYTSCGWFFDEVSGLETVQVLQYAGRAVQLAREVCGNDLEPAFLERLARAKSNLPQQGDGARAYERYVRPAVVDLKRVAAHYAISSLFHTYPDSAAVHCYTVEREDYQTQVAGQSRLVVGRARVTSRVERQSGTYAFGVLHFGDQNLNCGVQPFTDEQAYQEMARAMADAFGRADLPEALRQLDKHFGGTTYALKSLFRDEQRRILEPIMDAALADAEAMYRQVYQLHAPLMRFVSDLGLPLPKAFRAATEMIINANLRRALAAEDLDLPNITALLEEARVWQAPLDAAGLSYVLKRSLYGLAERLRTGPGDLEVLQKLAAILDLRPSLPFEVDLWHVQNVYYEMLRTVYSDDFWHCAQAADGGNAYTWLDQFSALGERLGIEVAQMSENDSGGSPSPITKIAAEIVASRRIPSATYRLQFNDGFTFRSAEALVPYLYDLGISDMYTSPLFLSGSGGHGYDVCDYGQINPALGGEEGLAALSEALRAHGMGLLLDTVPNHMGIGEQSNPWWMDVLENGPSSSYASYFDITWDPLKPQLANKVLLPILEDQYGNVLESGKLQLSYENGAFFLNYYQAKLPLAPRSYGAILGHRLPALVEALGIDDEHVLELQSILTALRYLPPPTEKAPEKIAERNREKEVIKRRVAALYEASPEVRAAIDDSVRIFNGIPGDPATFDLLDALLADQSYRPAYWRVAAEEINYRRFFDINTLAAVRIELPEVFRDAHRLVFRLLAEGLVTGLRIDHPDGLWDPPSYFRRLQEDYLVHQLEARLGAQTDHAGLARAIAAGLLAQAAQSDKPSAWPLYVVTEKILCAGEQLPRDWPVHGTTGYDFLNAVNALFVDAANRQAFDQVYADFVGSHIHFRNLVNANKKMVMLVSMASEVNALSYQLERIAEHNRHTRDFTVNSLTFAIREIIACLPVYRTYIVGSAGVVSPGDEAFIEAAVAEARKRNPRTAHTIFDFVRDTLLLRNAADFAEEDRPALRDFVMKFQQVTGPVMAKGVEDTAFYVYNRLLSLNEVGGNPEQFGAAVADFHDQNAERAARWPYSLLATSTHDTKRSEDVRARIDVLSELPKEWHAALGRWRELNAGKKTRVDGEAAPDANDEYLLYQSVLGAWPMAAPTPAEFATFRERIATYMAKATKEAKVHTSWVNPNEDYDAAVQKFVQETLSAEGENPFLADMDAFQRRVAFYGRFNALAQTLLKYTAPGVPDTYQGTELWDLSLVDPDNRRPVDYERRRQLLADLRSAMEQAGEDRRGLARGLVDAAVDGRIKLYLTHGALSFRRDHAHLFADGAYERLEAMGEKREHVVAFARVLEGEQALVVVPRLVVGLTAGQQRPPLGGDVWQNTYLPLPGERKGVRYRNAFTGEVLTVGNYEGTPGLFLCAILAHFPVALLERMRQ